MRKDIIFYFKNQGVVNSFFNLGLWSLLLYRIGRYMYGKLFFKLFLFWYLYLILKNFLLVISKIELPASAKIGKGLNLVHAYGLVMGDKVEIGDFVTIGPWVVIGHNGKSSEQPIIGDSVYIGAHACILGGVILGSGCFVGCNAVVTRSMANNMTSKTKIEYYNSRLK
jgi:serine O-acetyltransferase